MNSLNVSQVIAPANLQVIVDRAQLQAFADHSRESDPIFSVLPEAQRMALPDLPVPAGFLFSPGPANAPGAAGDLARIGRWVLGLDLDLLAVVHGEQTFRYHRLAFAGDRLVYRPTAHPLQATDDRTRVRREVTVHRGAELIAEMCTTTVLAR